MEKKKAVAEGQQPFSFALCFVVGSLSDRRGGGWSKRPRRGRHSRPGGEGARGKPDRRAGAAPGPQAGQGGGTRGGGESAGASTERGKGRPLPQGGPQTPQGGPKRQPTRGPPNRTKGPEKGRRAARVAPQGHKPRGAAAAARRAGPRRRQGRGRAAPNAARCRPWLAQGGSRSPTGRGARLQGPGRPAPLGPTKGPKFRRLFRRRLAGAGTTGDGRGGGTVGRLAHGPAPRDPNPARCTDDQRALSACNNLCLHILPRYSAQIPRDAGAHGLRSGEQPFRSAPQQSAFVAPVLLLTG